MKDTTQENTLVTGSNVSLSEETGNLSDSPVLLPEKINKRKLNPGNPVYQPLTPELLMKRKENPLFFQKLDLLVFKHCLGDPDLLVEVEKSLREYIPYRKQILKQQEIERERERERIKAEKIKALEALQAEIQAIEKGDIPEAVKPVKTAKRKTRSIE